MWMIKALKRRPYVAPQFLALLGVCHRDVVRHLGELDAVCLLAVLSLWEKRRIRYRRYIIWCFNELNMYTKMNNCTHITKQLSSFLGLGDVHTSISLPAHSFHPVQIWTILVLWSDGKCHYPWEISLLSIHLLNNLLFLTSLCRE